MRCIIVEDEPLARQGMEGFIRKTPFLEHVASFGSALKALAFMRTQPVDLLFLDIQMPDMTGLELMNALPDPPKVIFTTAYREFAVDGFDLNALDYLLKPISYERFLRAVQKTNQATPKSTSEDYFFIKSDGVMVKIPFSEIFFIETAKDYVFIHTLQQRHMALVPLRQLEEKLPTKQFIRVHRSYLINLARVTKIEGNLLHLGTHKVPISRRLKEQVYSIIIGNRLLER